MLFCAALVKPYAGVAIALCNLHGQPVAQSAFCFSPIIVIYPMIKGFGILGKKNRAKLPGVVLTKELSNLPLKKTTDPSEPVVRDCFQFVLHLFGAFQGSSPSTIPGNGRNPGGSQSPPESY